MAQNLPQNNIIISVTINIDIPITESKWPLLNVVSFSSSTLSLLVGVGVGCLFSFGGGRETVRLISCLSCGEPITRLLALSLFAIVKLLINPFWHDECCKSSNFLLFPRMMSWCLSYLVCRNGVNFFKKYTNYLII